MCGGAAAKHPSVEALKLMSNVPTRTNPGPAHSKARENVIVKRRGLFGRRMKMPLSPRAGSRRSSA